MKYPSRGGHYVLDFNQAQKSPPPIQLEQLDGHYVLDFCTRSKTLYTRHIIYQTLFEQMVA